MTKRIDETLELLEDIAANYSSGMSFSEVIRLRGAAQWRIANRRGIDPTTVSDKFRRQLRPQISGTSQFDKMVADWLASGSTELQSALERNAKGADLTKIQEFFKTRSHDPLEQEVESDLDGIEAEEGKLEGQAKIRLTSYFERDPKLRTKAIQLHGTTCSACGFNFEATYGSRGKDYIEVHHLVPLSSRSDPTQVNPNTDMVVLCSNCHRMVHRKRDALLSIDELKAIIKKSRDRHSS